MIPSSLRIVPVLIVASVPLLGLKVYEIVGAIAAEAVQPAEASPAAHPPSAAKPAPAKPHTAATAHPAQDARLLSPIKPAAAKATAPSDPSSYNAADIGLLGALAQRRAQLDKRAAELDQRAMLLKATEQKISEKIAKLTQLQAAIDNTLKQQDAKETARITNLARIYQLMRPQDAARIFEQLDMPVLLAVVGHMSEAKAAPILAAMAPEKAKALTLALAKQRQVVKP